jgi:hypothetical protein
MFCVGCAQANPTQITINTKDDLRFTEALFPAVQVCSISWLLGVCQKSGINASFRYNYHAIGTKAIMLAIPDWLCP